MGSRRGQAGGRVAQGELWARGKLRKRYGLKVLKLLLGASVRVLTAGFAVPSGLLEDRWGGLERLFGPLHRARFWPAVAR
jgi:hypothetical protein